MKRKFDRGDTDIALIQEPATFGGTIRGLKVDGVSFDGTCARPRAGFLAKDAAAISLREPISADLVTVKILLEEQEAGRVVMEGSVYKPFDSVEAPLGM